jgi:hypothetical protein
MTSVKYANNMWISVGHTGKIYSSADSINWNLVANQAFNFEDVVYGNGVWVVVGSSGSVYTSNDTVSWTRQIDSILGTQNLTSIEFGNGFFICGASTGELYKSEDGISWEKLTYSHTPNSINFIKFSNNTWVVGGTGAQLSVGNKSASVWEAKPIVNGFVTLVLKGAIFLNNKWYVSSSNARLVIGE